jgi:hypothetical protein
MKVPTFKWCGFRLGSWARRVMETFQLIEDLDSSEIDWGFREEFGRWSVPGKGRLGK